MAFGLGFQHLPRDLGNVNAWKTVFDPYIGKHLGPDQTMWMKRWLESSGFTDKVIQFGKMYWQIVN